jgi:hypothetical protein
MFENDVAARVFARRCSRIVFGLVLIAGAVIMVQRALSSHDGDSSLWGNTPPDVTHHAATVLLLSWVLAIGAGGLTYFLARQVPPRPRSLARAFAPSLVLPGIGMALTLPLTLHLWFAVLIGSLNGFEEWVRLSVWIVGPAHLVAAALVAVRGWRLAAGKSAPSPAAIWGIVIAVSCVPFVVYILPPFLVMLTGGLCLPFVYRMERIANHEREQLGSSAPADFPVAVAIQR